MANRNRSKPVSIYVLYFGGNYCYVGSTNNVNRRISGHFKDLKLGRHGFRILDGKVSVDYMQRVYNKYGLTEHSYDIVQENIPRANADTIEHSWFQRMRDKGYKLCNMARPTKHIQATADDEGYEKYCNNLSKAVKASYSKQSTIEHKRLANLRPETHAKRVAGAKRIHSNSEWRKRNSDAQKIAQNRAEVKAKISAASKRMHQRPDIKLHNSKMRAFINRYSTGRIYKYLSPIEFNEFVFHDWHHFIVSPKFGLIVFLWDSREIVYQNPVITEISEMPDSYVRIGHLDSFERLHTDVLSNKYLDNG